MRLPFIGYVQRRKPTMDRGAHVFGVDRNVRPNVTPPGHNAPEKPRDTDFNSRPSRMQIATFFNIAGINAVMEDHPLNDLAAPANVRAELMGRQHPVSESPNLDRGRHVTYGSMHVLRPLPYLSDYHG